MSPVIHKTCGAQVGWYALDARRNPDVALSKDFTRMDGTQPTWGEIFSEPCPGCGRRMASSWEMRRVWAGIGRPEVPDLPAFRGLLEPSASQIGLPPA